MAFTRVFIAASADDTEYEIEVATAAVRSLHLEPSTFNGLVPSARSNEADVSIELVAGCDLFVMILGRELDPKVVREYREAVKCRKPVLVFAKLLKQEEACQPELQDFIMRVRQEVDRELPGNIIVRSFINYRRLNELETSLKEAITTELHRELTSLPRTTRTRQEMYELGTQICSLTKRRLYVVQQTSILLLGPREYKAPKSAKIWYEVEYYDALMAWIDGCASDPDRECVCLYDKLSTKAEIEQFGLHSHAAANMKILKEKESRSQYRFHFVSMLSKHSGPLTVGDNWLALWVMGVHDAVSISLVNSHIANQLVDVLKPSGTRVMTLEEQMAELALA